MTTYLISTEIKGFKYYVKVPGVVYEKTTNFTFEGLRNNATEFFSLKDAERTISCLVTIHNLNPISKHVRKTTKS